MRVEQGNEKKENLSYKDYQDKVAKQKKQNITMFVSIFFVLLIVFLGVVRLMSPDVDISLGEDRNSQAQEDDAMVQYGVDSRLKELQREDELSGENAENATEEDGLVKIPKTEDKSFLAIKDEEPVATVKYSSSDNDSHQVTTDPHPISSSASPTSLQRGITEHTPAAQTEVVNQPKTYRVYVGMYSSQAQAEVARGILQDSGMGLTPVIKQAAGGFTLQVGAFSKKETASNLASRLLNNNYPARVVTD